MSNQKLPIRFRAATSEDANFILNSWLKSYRHSLFAKHIANAVYFTEQHKIIENILKSTKVIIACEEKDPNQIYGYICGETIQGFLVIHFVYVKHAFRNMGIGRALLNTFEHKPEVAAIYTQHTYIADRLAPKYNFVYQPYILFKDYCVNQEEKEDVEEKE